MARENQKKNIPALILITGLVAAPGAGAAPSIDSAAICTDGAEFRFVVDITETGPADPIRIRIDAESDPFVPPAERISINFDTVDGVVDLAQVETFDSPDFDRFQDGAIDPADLNISDLGGGSWRAEGAVANGTEPLIPGDEVAFVAFRSASGTIYATNTSVDACAGDVPSYISEVNLDDGAPWSPADPGDALATNGEGIVAETGAEIGLSLTVNLNDTDEWSCTALHIIDGIFISKSMDTASVAGPGPAFASGTFDVPATGTYDLEIEAHASNDCSGTPIASLRLAGGPLVIRPPAVAIIDPTATIGNNVQFGGTANVSAGAIIGDRVFLGDGVDVGENAWIQADAIIDDGTIVGGGSNIGEGANLTFIINGVFTPTVIGDGVTIGSNAQVFGAQVGRNTDVGALTEIRSVVNGIFAPASVGRNASIGDNSSIIGSEVRNGVSIGSDVEIRYIINGLFAPSVIGRNAEVGDGSVVEGTFIRTSAVLGAGVTVHTGSMIGHRATIGPGSGLGDHVTVKRDTTIGDGVQAGNNLIVRTGVVVNSGSTLGDNVDLGKNSSVGIDATIGNDVVISPGANVPDGAVIPDGSVFP